MKIKINYNEVNEVSKYINSKYEEIDLIYKEINKAIESVTNVWQGKDSNEFIEEATKNVNNEIEKNKKLKTFSDNLSTISSDYKEIESNWYESIKRESLDNG